MHAMKVPDWIPDFRYLRASCVQFLVVHCYFSFPFETVDLSNMFHLLKN